MSKQEEKTVFDDTDDLCVRNIGVFCADVVQKANSGHPGAPMGLAAAAHVLFSRIMTASGKDPKWINRDRFILSNGHGCALQYTMLHLCGYNMQISDLKSFRQMESITPGHPENFMTEGIEVSTGPLGQGLANAVGLAISQKYLQTLFNEDGIGSQLFSHNVFVFCGDGCMQEGVTSEACSLAGHLKLDNLICLYDDNDITIDGHTELSFTENTGDRFKSYGWNVLYIEDGNKDLNGIYEALLSGKCNTNGKPTLICCKTVIGYGCTKENTHGVHGSPLGKEVLADYKKKMGFDAEKDVFCIRDQVYSKYKETFIARGSKAMTDWNKMVSEYSDKYPQKGALLSRLLRNELDMDALAKSFPKFDENSGAAATRNINGQVLNALCANIPEIIGGAADLTPSTKTALKCSYDFQGRSDTLDTNGAQSVFGGRYLRFGVREFAMFCIGNGISAYGANLIPFTSTFLVFIMYGFGAVRLGALSQLRHIYIMTHDSVLLGEDGPTHQPVEVLPALRATPQLNCMRPCDGNEIVECWKLALSNNGPTVLCLSRQKVDIALVSKFTKSVCDVSFGAYVLKDVEEKQSVDCIVMASGSEVEIALGCCTEKECADMNIRVVSCPCLDIFEEQSDGYKSGIYNDGKTLVISIEASSKYGWDRYSHYQVCVPKYGRSAPLKDVRAHFGFTKQAFAKRVATVYNAYKSKNIAVPRLPVLYAKV